MGRQSECRKCGENKRFDICGLVGDADADFLEASRLAKNGRDRDLDDIVDIIQRLRHRVRIAMRDNDDQDGILQYLDETCVCLLESIDRFRSDECESRREFFDGLDGDFLRIKRKLATILRKHCDNGCGDKDKKWHPINILDDDDNDIELGCGCNNKSHNDSNDRYPKRKHHSSNGDDNKMKRRLRSRFD